MIETGFAFHVHHDKLAEFCTDYDERVRYIRENKPKEEQDLRLRLFKLIPESRLPVSLIKARATYDRAWATYYTAWDAYMPQLEALHKELCPNCPWDGMTIFSGKEK
ncbi:MAG: hypothetical protein Q8O55_06635 [Dehalococcoidales bacterium]|nr:hypothetical protein [Dehalococcoidales bacterium]